MTLMKRCSVTNETLSQNSIVGNASLIDASTEYDLYKQHVNTVNYKNDRLDIQLNKINDEHSKLLNKFAKKEAEFYRISSELPNSLNVKNSASSGVIPKIPEFKGFSIVVAKNDNTLAAALLRSQIDSEIKRFFLEIENELFASFYRLNNVKAISSDAMDIGAISAPMQNYTRSRSSLGNRFNSSGIYNSRNTRPHNPSKTTMSKSMFEKYVKNYSINYGSNSMHKTFIAPKPPDKNVKFTDPATPQIFFVNYLNNTKNSDTADTNIDTANIND
ncbi:hypothetical protein BB561_005276 [Smittium simulii]|uniref:Uncharacterized protein n=1 Tax=Smittium simulii TaxID=133385 RepID=A0A2T9YB73_9FUNG|nr:hypothetical protein BB561_005276 [Smittium simulii]